MRKQGKVLENIFSLLSLRGAEYIIAFVTLPYLLRVLGPDRYGAVVFAQAVINYGILVADYGFNLTAPRDIAKADKSDLPQQVRAIMVAKILLLIAVLLIGGSIVCLIPYKFDCGLLLCTLPLLIGNVLFPVWYFQGIQEMRFITFFNLAARIVSVVGIFTLVNTKNDYMLAAFLQSIVPLIAGIIAITVLAIKTPELFGVPDYKLVLDKFEEGWDIFISTLFINLYTNSNIFILGIMTNDVVVGYYAAANKLIEAVKGLMMPISNAVFPHVSVLFKESREGAIVFLQKVLRFMGAGSLLASLLVCVFAEEIVGLIMGDAYEESILILRIISFLPSIICLSNIFGIQTMVAFGMQRTFSRILMFSALLNFILIYPLIYTGQAIGLAINTVIVEMFVTVSMYFVLQKNNIHLICRK